MMVQHFLLGKAKKKRYWRRMARAKPETEKRRKGWITPDSSWGYYCSKPCPWRRRRAMVEAREACRRWGLSGSFLSFGLRLSWRGRCPATLRRREAWRGLRSWLRRWPLYWIWNSWFIDWRCRGWEDRVGLLNFGCFKYVEEWSCWFVGFYTWGKYEIDRQPRLEFEECIRLDYSWSYIHKVEGQLSVCAECLCFVLGFGICSGIDGSLWLRSCPRPGFGGSGRRERCDVASDDGSYTYKDQRDYWVRVFARCNSNRCWWEARSELWLLGW